VTLFGSSMGLHKVPKWAAAPATKDLATPRPVPFKMCLIWKFMELSFFKKYLLKEGLKKLKESYTVVFKY
jgi:hypothetical protein